MAIPLILALGLAAAASAGSPAPFNLVVMDLTSLSPGRLEPEFGFLTAPAAVFDAAVAPADRPAPSLASLLTSEYAGAHGVLGPEMRLSTAPSVLPEILERAGYQTAAFEAGTIPAAGLARGFGLWRDEPSAALAAKAARGWLAGMRGRSFFLLVRGGGASDAAGLRALWKDLERGGLLSRTVVVLVAETGDAGPGGLGDGVLRVPFAVWAPGVRHHHVARVVSAIAAAPTALALLGLPLPLDFEGADLSALVRGTASAADDSGWAFSAAASTGPNPALTAYAVSDARWKLIDDRAAGEFRLIDLKNDRREAADASEREPGRALELTQKLLRHIRETPAGPERAGKVSPEMLRRLRVNGYW
jgi:arylsulfatase A-like enzyme